MIVTLAYLPTNVTASDLVIALPGKAAELSITGASLISALKRGGFADCCKLVTLSGQAMRDALIAALTKLVNVVLGPLLDAGDSARAILACVNNQDVKGCAGAVKQTSDLIDTLVNDGGGFDYAGAVTLVVQSVVKEVGRAFLKQLLNLIRSEIDSLIRLFRSAVCGHCTGGGAKPPAAGKPAAPVRPAPPGMQVPPNLFLNRPPTYTVAPVAVPKPAVWPRYAVVGGALAVVAGAGWFFFRKPGKG